MTSIVQKTDYVVAKRASSFKNDSSSNGRSS